LTVGSTPVTALVTDESDPEDKVPDDDETM
jgi:hypothetical protein